MVMRCDACDLFVRDTMGCSCRLFYEMLRSFNGQLMVINGEQEPL